MRLKIDPSNSNVKLLKTTNVKVEHKDGYLIASGTFEDVNTTFRILTAHDSVHSNEEMNTRSYASAGLGSAQSRSSPPVQSVEVDETVMRYIKKTKPEQFDRLKKKNVVIEERKRHLIFSSLTGANIHAQLAQEEFITLYQKTATGLQTREYDLHPKVMDQLSAEFPDLLRDTSRDKLMLTGNFISLERFEMFLNGKGSPWNPNTGEHYGTRSVTQKNTTAEDKEETCPICLDTIKKGDCEVLPKCKHCFCKDCLKSAFQLKPTCPVCGEMYGSLTGTQPKGGTMNISMDSSSLPGYERYGTIIISYYIPSGTQEVRCTKIYSSHQKYLEIVHISVLFYFAE